MTQEINDGGHAFPSDNGNGMSLRDVFAAVALHALINTKALGDVSKRSVAQIAYMMAELMLEEQKKNHL